MNYSTKKEYNIGKLFRFLFYLTFLIAFVVPHSFQILTAALIGLTGVFSIIYLVSQNIYKPNYIDLFYLFSLVINSIYIVIGINNNAYPDSISQSVIIYAIFPLLWIFIFRAAYYFLNYKTFINMFGYFTIISALTVAAFFYLFTTFGADSVKMFIENPNITVNNGVYAATLFVYASFIFVASATFAVPYIFEGPVLRNTCIVSVLAVTATSGRSALLISCIIGVILRIFFRKFRHTDAKYQKEFSIYRLLIFAFSLISAIGFLYYFINVTSGVDISYTFETIYRKIGEGGGEERRDQWLALWNGIRQTSGLGAGHGVGVDLVRSDQYPWRYELFPVAMIYRVGVIGFALMMMPYFIYVIRFLKAAVKHNVTLLDSFMFAGFLGMFAASTTNPYPESFIYQWMLIGPMVLFEEYHSNFMRSRKV